MIETFCVVLMLGFLALTYKLWQYRLAIIQLQADMTLVLNELTRPPLAQHIFCNLCKTNMTPNEYAHHFCERLTVRAAALNDAKAHCYDAR